MELTARPIGEQTLVVSFHADVELEGGRSAVFKERIREAIGRRPWRVVVDMAHVRFIDAQGLGALVATLKALRSAGGDLVLAAPPESVRTVLEITKLTRVFETHPDVDSAVAALAAT